MDLAAMIMFDVGYMLVLDPAPPSWVLLNFRFWISHRIFLKI